MIIFYDKETKNIIGTIKGRVHSEEHLNMWIGDKEKTDRYIVPFKPNIVEEEVDVKELRVVDKKTMRVEEVVVGKKKEKVVRGMKPAVPFANLIHDFESGKKSIHDYKVVLNKDKEVSLLPTTKNIG